MRLPEDCSSTIAVSKLLIDNINRHFLKGIGFLLMDQSNGMEEGSGDYGFILFCNIAIKSATSTHVITYMIICFSKLFPTS